MPSVSLVPGSRWRTGTGSPEGVIAAPVGTVWTDTNATYGAIEWTKATGTGTTGWRVTKGDTGLVDVTSQSTIGGSAPIAGDKVEVQRTPHHLTLQIALAARSSPASPLHVTLPAWARPGRIRVAAVSSGGGTPTRMLYAAGSSDQASFYSLTASTAHYVDGLVLPIAPTVTSPWRTA